MRLTAEPAVQVKTFDTTCGTRVGITEASNKKGKTDGSSSRSNRCADPAGNGPSLDIRSSRSGYRGFDLRRRLVKCRALCRRRPCRTAAMLHIEDMNEHSPFGRPELHPGSSTARL